MRRVTFSRNFTLSLSRTCRCYCKYCAFATHRAHLYAPAEVEKILDDAARRGAKELLVLTGEKPEVNPEVAERLGEYGHADFTSYVAWACERALERGMLPHTNIGVCTPEELARLREVSASQGLMLESVNPDLVVHQGSPTKHPEVRLETIRAAGELRIPFTSGILVGIGESPEERVAALEALAAVHAEHGHLQEVILQNFVAHPRYYGAEPAEIADEAQRSDTHGRALELPGWADPITLDDMRFLVGECRRLMPDVGVQIPPNLSDWWLPLVEEGATDLGGLSANGDHISPEHPFPSVHRMRKQLSPRGYALTERLCVYPQYMDADWLEQGVLDVIKTKFWSFIPRRGSGRRDDRPIRAELVPGAVARARDGLPLTGEELTALFGETRPEAIEDMRQAADELRSELAGDTVTFVVNRNINVSNICTVGCAFCGFGQGRRSPDAYEHSEEEFRRRVLDAVEFGATEICMQSGIHPDWTIADYEKWLRVAKETAPQLHLHAYSPMEIDHLAADLPLAEVFARLRAAGLDSVPGTAAEVLHDGVRQRISPNKLPVARWVEIVEARPRGRPAHDGDGDVRPHRGALGAGRAHASGALAAGAHGRLHGVRAALVHPLPHAAGPHARDRGDLARGEPQAHGGVPARARSDDPEPAGQLGQDGAGRRHRGAALGRERPRRDAHGGVDLTHGRLVPRRDARAGRPDRRGPRRRPSRGRARHALRHPPPLRAARSCLIRRRPSGSALR